MLLAELIVRHTRRHMPTRRVALDQVYLPTSGSAHGAALDRRARRDQPSVRPRRATRAPAPAARPGTRRAGDPAHRVAPPAPARHARARSVSAPRARRRRPARHRDRSARVGDTAGARRGHGRGGAARLRGRSCCSTRSVGSIDGRWAGLADNVEVRTLWDRVSDAAAARGDAGSGLRARHPRRRCGAASRRSSGGRWKCSACAPGWTWSATT